MTYIFMVYSLGEVNDDAFRLALVHSIDECDAGEPESEPDRAGVEDLLLGQNGRLVVGPDGCHSFHVKYKHSLELLVIEKGDS